MLVDSQGNTSLMADYPELQLKVNRHEIDAFKLEVQFFSKVQDSTSEMKSVIHKNCLKKNYVVLD